MDAPHPLLGYVLGYVTFRPSTVLVTSRPSSALLISPSPHADKQARPIAADDWVVVSSISDLIDKLEPPRAGREQGPNVRVPRSIASVIREKCNQICAANPRITTRRVVALVAMLVALVAMLLVFKTILQDDDMLNPYNVLGIDEGAEPVEIKRAFRRLSLQLHPEKAVHSERDAERAFCKVAQAYQVLMHADEALGCRERYWQRVCWSEAPRCLK